MECPKCGAYNETEVGSCLSCGAPFAAEEAAAPTMMKPASRPPAQRLQQSGGPPRQCPNCMTLNAASFKFCARCGTPLTASAAPAPPAKVAGWPAAKPDAKPAAARPSPPTPAKPGPGTRPPPPAATPKATAPRARARISAIARDGSRSADYVLTQPETRVGRAAGDGEVKLDKDAFIAPTHAVFKFEGDQLTVQDGGTENGVFLWFKERQLESGDELRIGRQRLRIEWLPEEPETAAEQPLWGSPDPGYVARAVQLLEGGGEGDVFPLKEGENLVGRGGGDVSFPQDGYVSSRHCLVTVAEGQIGVKDLGSANGTFVKINGSASVAAGDLLLVGEQILRVDPA